MVTLDSKVKFMKRSVSFADSSNISTAMWDDETKEMIIEFQSGAYYLYSGVPREIFAGLASAVSPGKYFAKHVREQFQYTKLEES